MKTNSPHRLRTQLLFIGLLTLFSTIHSQAQAGDINTLRSNAITAMTAGDWAKALASMDDAIKQFDNGAMAKYGPKFGWFWYHKGYCELRLKKWSEAAKSFETCYTKYSNKELPPEKKKTGNYYEKLSILKEGDALKGAKNYAGATEKYKQFLKEREQKDKYDKGLLEINFAYCYSKINKLDLAQTHLENAIKFKKASRKTPTNQAIMTTFYTLMSSAITAKNQAIVDSLLKKNRGMIVSTPAMMNQYTPLFMKLGAEAYKAGMKEAALSIYGLVPSNKETESDIKSYLARLSTYKRSITEPSGKVSKDDLKKSLDELKAQRTKGESVDIVALSAMAYIHETNGNTRGAYAAYRQLEKFYKNSPRREDELYNLVRTASICGDITATEKYGEIFRKEYPTSKHLESVGKLVLSSLFAKGQYQKCIEIAQAIMPSMKKGSEQHDLALHLLGGSYYYDGQYGEAHEKLKQHQEEYGDKSKFKIPSLYFYGANLAKLGEWKKAAIQLDKYLKQYPTTEDNPYLSYALFDRANCHYAEEEMEQTLAKIDRIEKEFPNSGIMAIAYNLRGNVFEADKEFPKAEEAYKKALERAQAKGKDGIAGEAVYYLTALLGSENWGSKENTRLKDALPYYDLFWSDYANNSPYKAQVAVAGLLAMKQAGRTEEALERLQKVIAQMSKSPNSSGLEQAINSYTEAYLESYSAEQLKDHYYNFPGIDANDTATLALLRIAIIGVFEDELKTAKKDNDQNKVSKAEANIKVLFDKMDKDFNVSSLSNYILIRVGDYLRTNTASPRKALKYYDEIKGRPDKSHRLAAIFGSAEILGNSSNKADQDKAIQELQKVLKESDSKAEKEKSLYRIITTMANKGDWQGVEDNAREYKKRENRYNKFLPHVSYLIAKSYDERGMDADAHREYLQVQSSYYGYIKYSAPTTLRIMEILWKRNKPSAGEGKKSDKQFSYETGWNFVDATRRHLKKMSDEDKKLWSQVESLTKKYETSGSVMTMEEVKKKAAEAR